MARPSTFMESRSWLGHDCGKQTNEHFSFPHASYLQHQNKNELPDTFVIPLDESTVFILLCIHEKTTLGFTRTNEQPNPDVTFVFATRQSNCHIEH